MYFTKFIRGLIPAFLATVSLQAADISPSRTVVPDKIRNPPGKRYSIFAGDPSRVQKANEVNLKEFSAWIELSSSNISLSGENEELTARFIVHNRSAKSYTLSFPDAQRYDLALVTQDDQLIYLWSNDKLFVQETGMSFLNGSEKLAFTQSIPLSLIKEKCSPGRYKVAMILSNYPELKAAVDINVQP